MAFKDESDLRDFKSAVFTGSTNPPRAYIEFFGAAMRWPVDAFAPETRTVDGDAEHRVTWLKGNTIGHAVCRSGAEPTVTASVHPLSAVTRVEIGGTVHDKDFGQTIVRSLSVHFADDEPLVIDLDAFSVWSQREGADAFIDAVLDALS